ncbi:pilus assembly protein [Aquirhabdus sp.]|uniref:pilus assembly protein n=1 Tax=Aquirhabdus sp. TaxID=2824160 RepID=UPI00396CA356
MNMIRYQPVRLGQQRGATLIAVLFILLLITIIGVMAMRQGLTTLNISTNSQVRSILVQSSDTILNKFATMDLTASGAVSLASVIGSALDDSNAGREMVFCYRPTTTQTFGLMLNANMIHANPAAGASGDVSIVDDSGGSGFCDLTADFGSGRQAAVTQVAVTKPTEESSEPPGSHLTRDTSVSEGTPTTKFATQKRIRVTSTAMLPSMATGDLSVVQSSCLNGRISDNGDPQNASKETITDCLARNGVPANTQVQEYNLSNGLTQTTAIN